jgi:outer membrane lipoprotein-sorting protein
VTERRAACPERSALVCQRIGRDELDFIVGGPHIGAIRRRPGILTRPAPYAWLDLRPATPSDMIGHSLPTLEKMPYIPTMPKNRAIPAIAVSLLLMPLLARAQAPTPPAGGQAPTGFAAPGIGAAAPAAPPKEEPPTDAERTLDDAIVRFRKLNTFSADLVQAVDMLGQKFEVKGNCLKAPNNRIRLQLAVQGLGDSSATTLQVCDGTTLWNYEKVLDAQSYNKFTITQILKKLNDPVLIDEERDRVLHSLGFAGPDAMLVGLRKKVKFDQKAAETVEGKKVWVLAGKWKDRTGLTGPNNQPVPAVGPLPPYIPNNVAVWVGQEDGVPYKVEMYGDMPSMLQDGRRYGPDNRPIGAKAAAPKVDPSRITLTYTNVKINTEIPVESFAFQAPDAKNVRDMTDEYLSGLDQLIQMATMRKKAEAPGRPGEDSLIKGVMDVPKSK